MFGFWWRLEKHECWVSWLANNCGMGGGCYGLYIYIYTYIHIYTYIYIYIHIYIVLSSLLSYSSSVTSSMFILIMICFPVISFACSYSASKKKVIKEPRTDGHVKAYGMIVTYISSSIFERYYYTLCPATSATIYVAFFTHHPGSGDGSPTNTGVVVLLKLCKPIACLQMFF